ncbi:hypothetical protein G7Y89_g10525 [Cudoniella acicularis]|uniref:Carboxylic ester hydrolase n=1 Tax=Cudoniella acicularis TaxID=354080 RepID=A0A8H4W0V5_9HELO|nr:hypothetical protein G7Y89_g10525 [Cudoniella acicularis]
MKPLPGLLDIDKCILSDSSNAKWSISALPSIKPQLILLDLKNLYKSSNIRYDEAPVGTLRFSAPVAPLGHATGMSDGQRNTTCHQAYPGTSPNSFTAKYLHGLVAKEVRYSLGPWPGIPFVAVPNWTGHQCIRLTAKILEGDGEGLIFVPINYRLGLFAVLTCLTLDWVKENIHLFGGDASCITVMGQSAGAASIIHHITSNDRDELPFQQAIALSPDLFPLSSSELELTLSKVFDTASQLTTTSINSISKLRALPTEVLTAINSLVVGMSKPGIFTFGPAVDGSYVHSIPAYQFATGAYHKGIKTLANHTINEGLYFTPLSVQTQEDFITYLHAMFPSASNTSIKMVAEDMYPPVFNGTFGYQNQIERTANLVGDFAFNCNAGLLASSNPDSYAVFFAAPPALHGGDMIHAFAPAHNGQPAAEALQTAIVSFTINGKAEGLKNYGEDVVGVLGEKGWNSLSLCAAFLAAVPLLVSAAPAIAGPVLSGRDSNDGAYMEEVNITSLLCPYPNGALYYCGPEDKRRSTGDDKPAVTINHSDPNSDSKQVDSSDEGHQNQKKQYIHGYKICVNSEGYEDNSPGSICSTLD